METNTTEIACPPSLVGLIKLLQSFDLDASGTFHVVPPFEDVIEYARRLQINLGKAVHGVSSVLYYAQEKSGEDSNLVWILSSIGSFICCIDELVEQLKKSSESNQWPSSPDGILAGSLSGILFAAPYTEGNVVARENGCRTLNTSMIRLAVDACEGIYALEAHQLSVFSEALEEAYSTNEVYRAMPDALFFVGEWAALMKELIFIQGNMEFVLPKTNTVAA